MLFLWDIAWRERFALNLNFPEGFAPVILFVANLMDRARRGGGPASLDTMHFRELYKLLAPPAPVPPAPCFVDCDHSSVEYQVCVN